ncbi:hypothetical protein DXG03_007686 [Asterophora parasitica]|uniref:Uncharacterized protein n=1 Tax=Asterophora parasitica TaxID=117018 RepID=A0A9P7G9S0_9AGAR|nr:hypothetical protein DXG03_007686 [Asterophora parasitica]
MESFRNTHNLSNGSPNKYNDSEDGDDLPKKPWHHYLPLCGTVLLILAPHPSLLYVLVTYHLQTLNAPLFFAIHLVATYTLTFAALSSLLVVIVRDPGPVIATKHSDRGDDDEVGLTEALMPDIDFDTPGSWCRKCWVSAELTSVRGTTDVSRPPNPNVHIIVQLADVVY